MTAWGYASLVPLYVVATIVVFFVAVTWKRRKEA
jgi:hypothetical protein